MRIREAQRVFDTVPRNPTTGSDFLGPGDRCTHVYGQPEVRVDDLAQACLGFLLAVEDRRDGSGLDHAFDDTFPVRRLIPVPVRSRIQVPLWTEAPSVSVSHVDRVVAGADPEESLLLVDRTLVVLPHRRDTEQDKVVAKRFGLAVTVQGIGHAASKFVSRPRPMFVFARSNP